MILANTMLICYQSFAEFNGILYVFVVVSIILIVHQLQFLSVIVSIDKNNIEILKITIGRYHYILGWHTERTLDNK